MLCFNGDSVSFVFRFPCGRWLGKGADDGALERLLVAEPVPPTVDANGREAACVSLFILSN